MAFANRAVGGSEYAVKSRYSTLAFPPPQNAASERAKRLSSFVDPDGSGFTRLADLGVVNAFVGSNDSGKSQFLRLMAKSTSFQFSTHGFDAFRDEFNDRTAEMRAALQGVPLGHHPPLTEKIANLLMPVDLLDNGSTDARQPAKRVQQVHDLWGNMAAMARDNASNLAQVAPVLESALRTVPPLDKAWTNEAATEGKNGHEARVYIPALRGLRRLDRGGGDPYEARTTEDYFATLEEGEERPKIITGQSFYRDIRAALLGKRGARDKHREFEVFLSKRFFDNQPVTVHAHDGDERVWVQIGERDEFAIHELGDGIQAAILIAYPIFLEPDSLFFIEEPEVGLHPLMQRRVVELMLDQPRHQYFVTTHSNHLLDLTLAYGTSQISIYRFRRVDPKLSKFEVQQTREDDGRVLEDLGAQPSSLFLGNKSVWVEGITDRLYLREYLRIYQSKLPPECHIVEDVDYIITEYGGGNVIHWNFLDSEHQQIKLERLCGRAFLLADGDNDRKEPRRREIEAKLGDRAMYIEEKEIENTLPPAVIRKIVAEYEGVDVESLPLLPSVPKDKNLGEYLNEWLGEKKRRKGSYSRNGTISDKVNFCLKAVSYLQHQESLPLSAEAIAKRIHSFVRPV